MKHLALVPAILISLFLAASALAADAPSFRLGFKALADQIPEVAGSPTEEEHYGANGDSLQQTTRGLMAWRKADNWTAFTNGSITWVNGPNGVQSRPNDVRFDWEKDAPASTLAERSPVLASAPTPAPPPPAPAPQPQTSETGAAESAALEMINRSRQDSGAPALVMDEAIRQAARAHARDMSVRNFFAHTNPDGQQPWDRMRAAGATFSSAAENIGWAQGYPNATESVRVDHQSMMAETPPNDGHRVNILNRNYRRVGIGVYKGADGKVFYVTDFAN